MALKKTIDIGFGKNIKPEYWSIGAIIFDAKNKRCECDIELYATEDDKKKYSSKMFHESGAHFDSGGKNFDFNSNMTINEIKSNLYLKIKQQDFFSDAEDCLI
ncbi:MAG: hypothetical protein ACYDEI_00140 [Erysipelotrichaceae bacterium]